MEHEFVPLAIFNNKGGQDKLILERYEEPSWNNPVVRYFGPDQRELMPRKDRVWSTQHHAERLLLALEAAGKEVPGYLRLALQELTPVSLERAVFSMACYWKGEAFFGGLEGVRKTSAGWLEGQEVVEVLYDPQVIGLPKLVGQARSNSCANRVWVGDSSQLPAARQVAGEQVKVQAGSPRAAKLSDRKFHLRRSVLNHLDLTPLQATRANALLERGADLASILSPVQAELLQAIKARLAEDPGALRGLERPQTLAELPAYRSALRKRLEG